MRGLPVGRPQRAVLVSLRREPGQRAALDLVAPDVGRVLGDAHQDRLPVGREPRRGVGALLARDGRLAAGPVHPDERAAAGLGPDGCVGQDAVLRRGEEGRVEEPAGPDTLDHPLRAAHDLGARGIERGGPDLVAAPEDQVPRAKVVRVVGVLDQHPALAGRQLVEADASRLAPQEGREQQGLPAGKQLGQATDQLAGGGVGLAEALGVAGRDGGLPEAVELERREKDRAVGPPHSAPESRGVAERLRQAAGEGELLQSAVRGEGERRAVRREEGTEAVLRALDRQRVEGVELAKVQAPHAGADRGVDEARPVRRQRHQVLHQRHVDDLDVAPAQAGDREPAHGLGRHGRGASGPGRPDRDAGQHGCGRQRDEQEAPRKAGPGPRPARYRGVLRPIAGSPEGLVDLETGVRDVVEAVVRVLPETPAQEPAGPGRHLGGQSFPRRLVLHHRREHVGYGLPGERPVAREQLEEERRRRPRCPSACPAAGRGPARATCRLAVPRISPASVPVCARVGDSREVAGGRRRRPRPARPWRGRSRAP